MTDTPNITQNKLDKNSFRKVGDKMGGKIVIHTMPKRFLGIKPTVKKTKNVGMIILFGGALLMMAGFAFFYFYLMQTSQTGAKLDLSKLPDLKTQTGGLTNESPSEIKKIIPEEDEIVKEEVPEIKNETEIKVITADTESTTTATSTDNTDNNQASSAEIMKNDSSKVYKPAMDSDSDGLGDLEEMLLDCNLTSSDSDGDGYSDLAELNKLYNPAGSGQLMVNPNISKYTNNAYRYSLYFPKTWTTEKVGTDDSIIFKIGNNQFIQVIVQPSTSGQSIEEWYMEQFNVTLIKTSQVIYKEGWTGIKSDDGLIAYLSNPNSDNIYTLSYNIGLSDVINYKNIFDMMVRSLEITN